MESKLREDILRIEREFKSCECEKMGVPVICSNCESKIRLTQLARSYLAVIEKGETPKERNEENEFDETSWTNVGWNECIDAFLPLLVEKEQIIEEISEQYKAMKIDLQNHIKQIGKLEHQLSNKMTRERVVEIIDSAIDKHFEKDASTIPWVKFYGNPINFKQELVDAILEEWGEKTI
jgi:hypothetical protein